jgi:hypothetical protein
MGNCLDVPMIRIGTVTVRKSKFAEIKTYADALKIAGYDVPPGSSVQAHTPTFVNLVTVNSKFQIVDYLLYKGKMIPITRLYGKQ